jgi:hypothetical protein
MNPVQLAHAAHVFGAVGLFAAMGIEFAALRLLSTATTSEQARRDASVLRLSRRLGFPSTLAVLIAGFYLAHRVWAWSGPWFQAAFPAMLVLFVLGGAVSGRRIAVLSDPAATFDLARLSGVLWRSFWTRAGLLVATLFLMTAKPELIGTVASLGIGLAAGSGFAALSRRSNGS